MITLFTALATAGFSTNSFAWGYDGHGAIGMLLLEQLQPDARTELQSVLGSLDEQTIIEACNWPDVVRETDEWAWSYPLHYINIPQGETDYSESRDCPDGKCVTEALKEYAAELGDRQASQETRRQAFAWVCHLTGDLHQPLHAGYAHDRGGNDFDIIFNGEETNLHNYWDRALIKARAGDWRQLRKVTGNFPSVQAGDNWAPSMVDRWTEESHQFVEEVIYPKNPEISKGYEDKSWQILQQRITTAASRLALIINTVL